jgi:hypothetical protein
VASRRLGADAAHGPLLLRREPALRCEQPPVGVIALVEDGQVARELGEGHEQGRHLGLGQVGAQLAVGRRDGADRRVERHHGASSFAGRIARATGDGYR